LKEEEQQLKKDIDDLLKLRILEEERKESMPKPA
jgi:hypothetical protein